MKTLPLALAITAALAISACDRRETDGQSTTPPAQGAASEEASTTPSAVPADPAIDPGAPAPATPPPASDAFPPASAPPADPAAPDVMPPDPTPTTQNEPQPVTQ